MLRRLKTSEKSEVLREVPLFATCTAAELDKLGGLATESDVHEGQVLCTVGESGGELFVLLAGSADIVRADGETIVAGAGEFFGELALLDGGPRTATITMTSDGRVLTMSGQEFRSLLQDVPKIAIRMLAVLGARMRSIADHRS